MNELTNILEHVKKKISGLSDIEKIGMKFAKHESDAENVLNSEIEKLYKKHESKY